MRAVLLELRYSWFEIEEGGEYEGDYETKPFTWIPKQALISEWKELRNAAVKKVAGQAVQAQAIAHGAKKRLDALSDEDMLIKQLSIGTPPNTLPLPGPIINKRKASRDLSPTPSARKSAWQTIQETRKKALYSFRSSLMLQMECNRVVSQYKEIFDT